MGRGDRHNGSTGGTPTDNAQPPGKQTRAPSASPADQASLISVLGEGAINRRVKRRVMGAQDRAAADSAPISLHPHQPSLLNRLSLRLEQVYAGLLSWDREFLDTITMRLLRDEVPFSTFYREIAVPVAERLGDAWTDDRLSIVDVEFAASRLSLWCDQYAAEDHNALKTQGVNRRILLARTPGEKHTLGLSIVSKCYAHAGWQVDGGPSLETGRHLVNALRDQSYEVVGVSVGNSLMARDCRMLINDLRLASKNPALKVGLGGPAVIATPDVFSDVGADFTAADALQAVQLSNELVAAA